ncbi:hypothetical protein O4H49_20040 [Kiloniella laminariae]|uniref:Bacterial virulence protein VirB8 domain-containing protein n=1 Tax=Kiloniella laminariae TaxID=454162 RepID=A0ABT4LPY0_9PROT|nr:hypothetical protein [Kiloniella laminariae]MCZ4283086.1 hypothetical protein [Kiloniella laminariae]
MDQDNSEYLDHEIQEQIFHKRSQGELVRAQVQNRKHWFAHFFMLAITAIAVYSAFVSNERFANNVQVAWVKLSPDGTHEVKVLADGGADERWFDTTIDASLMNYAESRFKKQKETIEADYGFAQYFMGDALLYQFMEEYNAPKVAAEFIACSNCNQTLVKVRAIDHQQYLAPQNNKNAVYRSTLYVTEIERTPEGFLVGQKNLLIPITWKLRDVGEITENPALLQANPLGIKIIEEAVRQDLTAAGGES